jgi:hypothetical protein
MVDAIEQSDSGRLVRLCRAHIVRPKEFYLRANSAADATSDRREAPPR